MTVVNWDCQQVIGSWSLDKNRRLRLSNLFDLIKVRLYTHPVTFYQHGYASQMDIHKANGGYELLCGRDEKSRYYTQHQKPY